MHRGSDDRQQGFTLIEMLVALVIYALALAVLLAGLRSGTRAWATVRDHQREEAAVSRAIETIRDDFRHLVLVNEEIRAIVEIPSDQGGDSLTLTRLGARERQRAGGGAVWEQVSYVVKALPGESTPALHRTVTPAVVAPLASSESSFLLLENVREIQINYASGDETLPEWDDSQSLPSRVDMRVIREHGRSIDVSVVVPLGLLLSRGAG